MNLSGSGEIASSEPIVEAPKPKIDNAVTQAEFQKTQEAVNIVQTKENASSGKVSTPQNFSIDEKINTRESTNIQKDIQESFKIAEKYKNNPVFEKAIKEKSSQISNQINQIISNNPNIDISTPEKLEQAKQILTFGATINDPKNSELKNQLINNGDYQKFMDGYNSLDQNHIFLAKDISDYQSSPSAEKFIVSTDKKDNFVDLGLDIGKQQELKEIYLDANQNLFMPLPEGINFEDYKNVILNKDNFRQNQQNAPKIALVLQALNDPKIHQAHQDMIRLISQLDTGVNQSHKLYALNAMKTMLTTSIAGDFHINEVVVNENPLSFGVKSSVEGSKIDINWIGKDILMTQYGGKDESGNMKILSKKINDTFSLPSPTDIMSSKPDINLANIFKEKKSADEIKNSIDETIKKNFDNLMQKPGDDFARQRLEMSREANGQAMMEKIISISSPPEARQNYLSGASLNEQEKSFRPMIEKFDQARKNMSLTEQRQAMQIFSNPKFEDFVKESIGPDGKPKQTFDMFCDLKIFDIASGKFDMQKMKDFSDALAMPDLQQFNTKLLEKNIDLRKNGYEFSSRGDSYFLKDTGKRRPNIEDDYLNVLYGKSS